MFVQKWGLLLNRSRDLARQACAFVPTEDWHAKATLCRWVMAYSKAMLCHLRPRSSLRAEMDPILDTAELQILLAAEHPTVMCLQARRLCALVLHSSEPPSFHFCVCPVRHAHWLLQSLQTVLHDCALAGCRVCTCS